MTVIDKKPVPLYEQKCSECGSTFIFRKAEISFNQLNCPVCGFVQWASFSHKVKGEGEETDD